MKRIALILALSMPLQAQAVEPGEVLEDPAMEQRARDLSKGLRCLVCRNQSIDDSDAGLAKDLRILVRERLVEGDTDEQVLDYVVARYGEYVLLSPRFSPMTALLYLGGPLLLLLGGTLVWRQASARATRPTPTAAPLTDAERARLRELGIDPET
jgi:cytochrome c-type biogenesis protein CcmH